VIAGSKREFVEVSTFAPALVESTSLQPILGPLELPNGSCFGYVGVSHYRPVGNAWARNWWPTHPQKLWEEVGPALAPQGDLSVTNTTARELDEAMPDKLALGWKVFQIVWINVLLSGDNAILIALACHGLPKEKRRLGVVLGAVGAVTLRIVFTLVVVELLAAPYLRIFGGALVIFVAAKLPYEGSDHAVIETRPTLLGAVMSIVVADTVMSLDNVFAIAAAANGSTSLIVFGLALSAPLVMFGASFLIKLINRFPILIWGGVAIMGWAGGELIGSDSFWMQQGFTGEALEPTFPAAGCAAVLLIAVAVGRYKRQQYDKQSGLS